MKKSATLITLLLILIGYQFILAQPWYLRGDFNGWMGTAEQLVDDGTNGDLTAGDGIFSRLVTIATAGRSEYKVTVDDWSVNYPASNSWFITTTNNQVVFFTFNTNSQGDTWLPDVNIVNTDDQAPPTTDVIAAGDHNSWNNAGPEVMHDDGLDGDWLAGDGIFAWHSVITTPGNYGWKAVLTGTWDAWGSDNRAINADNVAYTTTSPNEDVYFYLDSNTGRVNTTSQPLPVELISFTANVTGTVVSLNWKTATELNNQGFEIERKISKNWIQIGFVEGNGTTSETQSYLYKDNIGNISDNQTIYYRLKQVDFNGSFEYSNIVEVDVIPSEFSLNQNYPNPFNPSTKITYNLAQKSFITLKVYDAIGSQVTTLVQEEQEAGSYEVQFDAINLTSGIYFYRIEAGKIVSQRKMLLLK